ncbi:beta-microseminoprotein-like isoform X4 [Polyodon spathula]|uniref:beta-microseminoprotein-like isoform X4 n=1 Tax=Polyodon spathula TaxID=7913 RepID=UPI001B7D9FB1|nr:beta-microseminoprotein-like isoform X4 [Polyodon spathula]
MKFLVGSLLLCAVVHLGQSYCYKKELKIKPGEAPPTHCVDTEDGTKHTWGSEWRNSKCMDCTCHSCCTASYSWPVPCSCVLPFTSASRSAWRVSPAWNCPQGDETAGGP